MLDFTINIYLKLIKSLLQRDFNFCTFKQYLSNPTDKSIILRHDIDKFPENSLIIAKIQYDLNIVGSYYFRIIKESFNPDIISKISSYGHEIGYHYEDVYLTAKKLRYKKIKSEIELIEKSIKSFEINLNVLRRIVPVKTICMHGSPLSKWDSRLLWKYYDYRDFGIIGEPYFDLDFSDVLYLTDTGRKWNADRVNVRDKLISKPGVSQMQLSAKYNFRKTSDVIQAIMEGKTPDRIMMTFHPQRWSNNIIPWSKELIWQNTKNIGKFFLIKLRT